MSKITLVLALLSGVIPLSSANAFGTARLGKSCIAWEEAVFLRSLRQRLTRDVSKTVEPWVIPRQTLRAIAGASFRSKPLKGRLS
jgi:hypothetical protein